MNKRPTILIIENSIHVTGALKSITRTAFDLKGFYDFVFVIPKGSAGRFWIESKGFTSIHEVQMSEISRRIVPLLFYLPRLLINTARIKQLMIREKIDIVHVNDLYNLIPVCLRIFGVNKPYVCHIRFLPDKFPPWLFNLWLTLQLKFGYKLVAVSNHLKSKLPQNERIVVIHNELPVEERYTVDLKKHPSPTLLYLSNIIPGKGHRFALEAFMQLHQQFSDWRLRFVGGDMGMAKNAKYIESLKEYAATLGISDKIKWEPFASDVEFEYKQAHVILNFSESESFSITCLEALYFGRAVIATDCGGPAEIIDHMETGVLVPNRNVDAMVDAMRRLMGDEDLRESLGKNGRKKVRAKFSIENTSLRLKELYDQALVAGVKKT